MAKHYTAVIEVQRVEHAEEQRDSYNNKVIMPEKREVAEVARLVLRASTVNRLKEKIAAHIELVED